MLSDNESMIIKIVAQHFIQSQLHSGLDEALTRATELQALANQQ